MTDTQSDDGLPEASVFAASQQPPWAVTEEWMRGWNAARTAVAAALVARQPEPVGEAVAWEGGEGWESLAWELCADENGEDACNELIWEGGPVPEPWGERWLKYEDEAKRLIKLVHKHASPAPQAAQAYILNLTEDQEEEVCDMLRNTFGLDGDVEEILDATIRSIRDVLATTSTPPSEAEQAEAPSDTTIKRAEWESLSPEAQGQLRDMTEGVTSRACPACRGSGVIGIPGAACPFCKLHNLGATLPASKAEPVAPPDPMDWPLPCDVKVGHMTMCKGVKLRTLVTRMKVLHETAFGPPPSPEEMADRRARFFSAVQPEPVAPPVQEWRLVPVKPTEQMIAYAAEEVSGVHAEMVWSAMLEAAPAQQPEATNPWKQAVLDQCMLIEGGYVESDPAKTVANLIDWHVLNERRPTEASGAGERPTDESAAALEYFAGKNGRALDVRDRFISELRAALATKPPQSEDEGPDFTVEDTDLNDLLNFAAMMVRGCGGMDLGVAWLDALEKVEARLASKPPAVEQKPVFQWRTKGCADWYDGHPDPEDGGGPYETRTLYTAPVQPEQVAQDKKGVDHA